MTSPEPNPNADWIRRVVECHEQPLIRYASRMLNDHERARDVVQDTFLQLCRQSQQELEGRVTAWLYTVCRNRALDIRKKESRMSHVSDPQAAAIESREPNQGDQAEQRETAHSARQLLSQLPDQQQEVIRLKLTHGLSYREIGEITGLSISNVGYLLHIGIKSIREQFAS
ncbi:MAG: sigma-70 family RNA polymerase sigma factor [Planctomycetota bacterium]|jgi:RNA polymerase sigma-70 factor (ECF subfamily)|nr:sigma-70 family RNA polymerase sigma factor [Planctomycetota bacterium]